MRLARTLTAVSNNFSPRDASPSPPFRNHKTDEPSRNWSWFKSWFNSFRIPPARILICQADCQREREGERETCRNRYSSSQERSRTEKPRRNFWCRARRVALKDTLLKFKSTRWKFMTLAIRAYRECITAMPKSKPWIKVS